MPIVNYQVLEPFYRIWQSNAVRLRMPTTVIFIAPYYNQQMQALPEVYQADFTQFLSEHVRQTDVIFEVPTMGWSGILLLGSKENEAYRLLERLSNEYQASERFSTLEAEKISFKASITEIRQADITFEQILTTAQTALGQMSETQELVYIPDYRQAKREQVKLSIIESDPLMNRIIKEVVQNLPLSSLDKEIRTFVDGEDFLSSDFYQSPHNHIVIMNDVLPRKTGLDILASLRSMPNDKKFVIYMMTNRNAESAMIDAYEKGVDYYLVKPFNLKLFSAQLKRMFESLW